jgi:pimeloyl-ACP methyl ester carboxylesterase
MPPSSTELDAKAPALPNLELVKLAGPSPDFAALSIGIRQAGPSDRPPVLCLHGIGSNASGFRAQLSGLAPAFRVIAWDAPGYGRSDSLPWPAPKADQYADALLGLADALGLDRVNLVGSSFGAVVAAAFAARYPDRTRAVVLSAPATGNARLPDAERQSMLRSRIGDMERLGPAGVAEQRASFLVAPDSAPAVVAAAKQLVAATRPEGYAQAAHTLDSADTLADAEAIAAPVLVLVGSEDRVTPAATCAWPIHARLKHGELEVLDGMGHLLKLEAPERFNDLVSRFLTQHQ